MGGLISRIFRRRVQRKILMNGLDAAGKTTILYRLKLGEVVTTIPTIGFNVETVEGRAAAITVWDVGGRDKIRPLWRYYYEGMEGLVFVVDSNDRERIDSAKEELWQIVCEQQLEHVAVLLFANKQDLPNAMSVSEMSERLDLHHLHNSWLIQGCCATDGRGLQEGIEWIEAQMERNAAKKHAGNQNGNPNRIRNMNNNNSNSNSNNHSNNGNSSNLSASLGALSASSSSSRSTNINNTSQHSDVASDFAAHIQPSFSNINTPAAPSSSSSAAAAKNIIIGEVPTLLDNDDDDDDSQFIDHDDEDEHELSASSPSTPQFHSSPLSVSASAPAFASAPSSSSSSTASSPSVSAMSSRAPSPTTVTVIPRAPPLTTTTTTTSFITVPAAGDKRNKKDVMFLKEVPLIVEHPAAQRARHNIVDKDSDDAQQFDMANLKEQAVNNNEKENEWIMIQSN